MKSLQHTLFVLLLILLTSCGEDRTGEFYALIEDRMWIEDVMRENYLWAEDMPVIAKEDDYFQEPATFFKNMLSKNAMNGKGDKYSYMEQVKHLTTVHSIPIFFIVTVSKLNVPP